MRRKTMMIGGALLFLPWGYRFIFMIRHFRPKTLLFLKTSKDFCFLKTQLDHSVASLARFFFWEFRKPSNFDHIEISNIYRVERTPHLVLDRRLSALCSTNNFAIMRGHEWVLSRLKWPSIAEALAKQHGLGCGQGKSLENPSLTPKSGSGSENPWVAFMTQGIRAGFKNTLDSYPEKRHERIFQMFVTVDIPDQSELSKVTSCSHVTLFRHFIGWMSHDMPDMWH